MCLLIFVFDRFDHFQSYASNGGWLVATKARARRARSHIGQRYIPLRTYWMGEFEEIILFVALIKCSVYIEFCYSN